MMKSILETTLYGGLCNKLFCFFSACDIAVNNNIKILEPRFGWPHPNILFSDIYDLDKFNLNMKPYNNGQHLLIPFKDKSRYAVKRNDTNLWNHSTEHLRRMRRTGLIPKTYMGVNVLNSLELNEANNAFAKQTTSKQTNSLQIRIERDWQKHIIDINVPTHETLLIDLDVLIEMYKIFSNEDVFFTTGENHNYVKDKFITYNVNSDFYFNSQLEYEVNAAINFHICCQSKKFVGLSRSTFSNLITLKRALNGNNNSYLYNLNNEIVKRTDMGLYPDPVKSISKKTKFV